MIQWLFGAHTGVVLLPQTAGVGEASPLGSTAGAAGAVVFTSTAGHEFGTSCVAGPKLTFGSTSRAGIAALAQPLVNTVLVESMPTLQHPALLAFLVVTQTYLLSAQIQRTLSDRLTKHRSMQFSRMMPCSPNFGISLESITVRPDFSISS